MDNHEHDVLKGILNSFSGFIDTNEPHEVTFPATKETFPAQVLVITKERKEKRSPSPFITTSMQYPLSEVQRVIGSKKFSVELIVPSLATGMPTLIISEE
jgi:hypothetical protein